LIRPTCTGYEGRHLELELKHLLGYARRWWWLLVLLPLLSVTFAHDRISRRQPLYSATATLLIRPAQQAGDSSDYYTIAGGQLLATTYQQLVATEPVLSLVAEELGAPFTAGMLQGMVSSSTVSDTSLLRISVSSPDPEEAAKVANTVASKFQAFISDMERTTADASQSGLQGLIEDSQGQIDELQGRIASLEAAGSEGAQEQAELPGLRAQLTQQQQSLADLYVRQQALDLSVVSLQNQARVLVPSAVPGQPYAPRLLFYTVLAGFMGGLIAVGTVGLLEYLDNTVKPSLDFQARFGAPLMSVVPTLKKLHAGSEQVFVTTHPYSNSSEAIRLLRTNVEFAAASREIGALMVTSAVPGEGKSTVTANLAVAMSQSGFSVIVVDADLRRPTQHKIFGLGNSRGLTTLLTHHLHHWSSAAVTVGPNISVIPSGPLPPNPADLLSSDHFRALLRQLRESADVVLIDTPPVLAVSDPLAISTLTDGVLLVAQADQTRTEVLGRAFDAFPEAVRRVGVVLNLQKSGGSGDYYYYSGYYGPTQAYPSAAAGTATPELTLAGASQTPLHSASGTDDTEEGKRLRR